MTAMGMGLLRSLRERVMFPRGGRVEARAEVEGRKDGRSHEGGALYALWGLALPFLLGGTAGWFASVCLGVFLDRFEDAGLRRQSAPGVEVRQEVREGDGLAGFLAANPFRISPPPLAVEEKPVEDEKKVEVIGSLATAVLRGTMPDVGAWLEDSGQLHLVLVGSSFDVYTLGEVSYREAVFVRGDDVVVRELLYGELAAKKPAAQAQTPKPTPVPSAPMGNVVAATANQEGQISSEMVNQLIQNPFDELKKVRLRPANGAPGLQVQWIQNDSILRKLGVRKGDVIKSVNGIPFSNMADIANSISSLMSSERFDVEVTRRGKKTSLRYAVR